MSFQNDLAMRWTATFDSWQPHEFFFYITTPRDRFQGLPSHLHNDYYQKVFFTWDKEA
jgi:hypothetical protein